MLFCPLCSGSSGNASFLEAEGRRFLIDAGLTRKRIAALLESIGVPLHTIDAVFLTHEHVDHVAGAGVLARAHHIPVYAAADCFSALPPSVGEIPAACMRVFEPDREFFCGKVRVLPFSTPHDAAHAVGYSFMAEGRKVTVMTDVGHVDDRLLTQLSGSDLVLLEANHDVDMLLAGLCGILGGLINHFLERMTVNPLFVTIFTALVMALAAYGMNVAGILQNVDGVVIGTLMILVPGLLFTNAMRDIIHGDTNSGITRIVQVLLIAMGMALGTAIAWKAAAILWREPVSLKGSANPLLITCLGSLMGCVGFSILFNIHGPGGTLCALGGVLTWLVYDLAMRFLGEEMIAFFLGSFFASVYAEVMARIRKYPAISYLVVSLFPLIPGAGIYYTMNYAVHGNMERFAAQGMHTAAIAGVIAVGVLLVTTIVRLSYTWRELYPRKR